MRIFKAAAVIAIAALAVGIGCFGSQALAGTSSQAPLYVSNVFVGPSAGRTADRDARQEWIGKDMTAVVDALGRPSQVYRLKDTGGRMLIYLQPFHKHYVFDLDPAQVADATPTR